MYQCVRAFKLRTKALSFEAEQTKKSDLDAALSVFRLCIPDRCPLWPSKIALAGEKPHWYHKDEPEFSNFAYLKTASDFKVGTLIIDIDEAIADVIEALILSNPDMPIPNLIIKNRANKHVQLVYCLKNWVCIDTSNRKGNYSAKAHSFYKSLKRHLNTLFNADANYHNYIAKNPYSNKWDVVGLRSTSYELYELARISGFEVKSTSFIERLQRKQQETVLQTASKAATVPTGERNEFLFNTVRVRAYRLYNQYSKKWTRQQFENCLNDFANELNETKCTPPLEAKEVAVICHSITSYCYGSFGEQQRLSQSEISKKAAECGKKGGRAKGYAYAQQRQQARKLHRAGKKAKDIAEITGLSIRAVYNAINASKVRKTAQKEPQTTVQKNYIKTYKYHKFTPIICANNYQCSAVCREEFRRNSHSGGERSEPALLFHSFNRKFMNNSDNSDLDSS